MKKIKYKPKTLTSSWLEKQAKERGHRFYNSLYPHFWLCEDDPELWEVLMTIPVAKELNSVDVQGSRIMSGNGAIDGTLKVCYRERLQKINEQRKIHGWQEIR